MKSKFGFTLIELLVVVAIIGILASVVIVSLTGARNKGDDSAVKSNLNSIRGQAEVYYLEHSNSFGARGYTACPTVAAAGSLFSNDPVILAAILEATKRSSGTCYCIANATSWALATGLKENTTKSWCVDSSGASKVVTKATPFYPGSTPTSPYQCN